MKIIIQTKLPPKQCRTIVRHQYAAAVSLAEELAKGLHEVYLIINTPKGCPPRHTKPNIAYHHTQPSKVVDVVHKHLSHGLGLMITQQGHVLPNIGTSWLTYTWLFEMPGPSHIGKGYTGVFTPSLTLANSIHRTHKVPSHNIHPIGTGVASVTRGDDTSRDDQVDTINRRKSPDEVYLIYTIQPEHGLLSLVRPGGILDKLSAEETDETKVYHLLVCLPKSPKRGKYEQEQVDKVLRMIEKRNDVTRTNTLNREQLIVMQVTSTLAVHPSTCKTMSTVSHLEYIAAGTPMLSSDVGAARELSRGTGCTVISNNNDGTIAEWKWVAAINVLVRSLHKASKSRQLRAAQSDTYSWRAVSARISHVIEKQ